MITAVICAAGRGERAGFAENKILREHNGLSVLARSLCAFAQCEEIGEILVACRDEDRAQIERILRPYPFARTVRGGAFRTDSVYAALCEAQGEIVLVHDGARPFVTPEIIRDCIASVKEYGSGVCAVAATDTVALAENGCIASVPARQSVYAVQTPQGFSTKQLLQAYERAYAEGKANEFTDESGIYARYIAPPRLCGGARENKKLTYPEDFSFAERTGFGADTHAFYTEDEGAPLVNFITLGGIKVPSEKILKAHSDGDVLLHALMDALLTGAGLRDIGYYFHDTDPAYRGADSADLLGTVMRLLAKQGLAPANASISILAETPRLAPYIERMKENVAQLLRLSPSFVGIAAGTNEKLGYIGEKKGITVYATVLLKKC